MTDEERPPEPHAMLDEEGELWFRDDNGQWYKHERVSTGDPELDTLWDMSADEVDRIANDGSDPLREKAKQVQHEAIAPLQEMLKELSYPHKGSLGKSLGWTFAPGTLFAADPDIDTSFHTARKPTIAEELALRKAALKEMRRTNEYWRKFIENAEKSGERANKIAEQSNDLASQANRISERSNEIAKASKTVSWWAFGVSLIAAAAAVISIFM